MLYTRFLFLIFLFAFTILSFAQKNLFLEGQLGYNNVPAGNAFLNDIWGYTASDSGEYALVGLTDAFSVVQIDSTNPKELFRIPGPVCVWRDIKVWKDHAYVVHEAFFDTASTSSGLLICDLSFLPDSMPYSSWYGPNNEYWASHNIFIDEKGFAYLFGNADTSGESTLILDLADPKNPVKAGKYTEYYVHDGFVRGDTLWASEVYEGILRALDVSDKQNISSYGSVETPNKFCHNVWLSNDNKYAFTTDERRGAFVGAFDVSDPSDMQELDKYQPDYGDSVVPHNTFYIDGYLVTSYYSDGVTIVDAHRPNNLIEVGYFDTSPFNGEEGGFGGCWGVYPYFPSGRIVASDRQEGLFVLNPQYKRACYLEGNISSSETNTPLPGVNIEIIGNAHIQQNRIDGNYYTGVADSGTYDVRFTHSQCSEMIKYDVELKHGQVTQLNIIMNCGDVGIEEVSFYENTLFLPFSGEDYLLELYSLNAQLIRKWHFSPGSHILNWDRDLGFGIYILKVQSKDLCRSIKLINH
jgi:choice-of-anchor B domain-containing protein